MLGEECSHNYTIALKVQGDSIILDMQNKLP